MKGLIYKITNKINGKVYIGQTIQTIEKRWYQHLYDAKNGSQNTIHMAIAKYGEENFSIELVEYCDSLILDDREIYWIAYYNSYNNGYNMTKGGSNLYNKITKRKIIDESLIFSLWNEGKSRKEIEEVTGYSSTAIKEHLKKCPTYSEKESNKRGRSIASNSLKKKIYQWSKDGKFIGEYDSAVEAEQITGVSRKNISLVLNNKSKTAGGFIWTFTKEKPNTDIGLTSTITKVYQCDLQGNILKEYISYKDAENKTGIKANNIGAAARGEQKTAGGYIWKKVND